MIKKIFSCIVILFMLFSTGCNSKTNIHEIASKDAEKIFELLQNEDVKQLSEMFSTESKENHDIENELQLLFESIDGNITNYDKLEFGGEEEGYDKEGVLYKQAVTIIFKNVLTDKGTNYDSITYLNRMVWSIDEKCEGINVIQLIKDSSDDESEFVRVGY